MSWELVCQVALYIVSIGQKLETRTGQSLHLFCLETLLQGGGFHGVGGQTVRPFTPPTCMQIRLHSLLPCNLGCCKLLFFFLSLFPSFLYRTVLLRNLSLARTGNIFIQPPYSPFNTTYGTILHFHLQERGFLAVWLYPTPSSHGHACSHVLPRCHYFQPVPPTTSCQLSSVQKSIPYGS